MVLGINWGIGGCVLDMGKKMGWVPRLETAGNNEFLKSVIFFWTFVESENGSETMKMSIPRPRDQFDILLYMRFQERSGYMYPQRPPEGRFLGGRTPPS